MKLQGRDLSFKDTGEDVSLLQEELQQLGYSIGDSEGYFGNDP